MFKNYKAKISIIGLGYVGLPLAHAFIKKGYRVVGFDINEKRLAELRNGKDSTGEIHGDELKHLSGIDFTSDSNKLKSCNFHIITVPTPIDKYKKPDLTPVIKATENIARHLAPGSIIVYESTVFPGVTEEICLPIIEKLSGLKYGQDFKLGYSPERINPGDREHTVTKITKVVSGSDQEALDLIDEVYSSIIIAGTHKASSIKVAEAAKVIENTQRDINIGLINELSLIFDRIGINTYDVLAAAGTKWNFLRFQPGLVGGHCIGVDPYYLVQKAEELGYNPQVITAGRRINDGMAKEVANQMIKLMIKAGIQINKSRVLILGLTFKENVPDFRNSRVCDTIKELKEYGVSIEGYDPYSEVLDKHTIEELNLEATEIIKKVGSGYDGVFYAVTHAEFRELAIEKLIHSNGVIFDVKGVLRTKNLINYKSL